MSRPSQDEPEHPTLICSIEQNGAFRLDGSKSGKVTLTFDSSQSDVIAELYKHYTESELHVVFIKVK